MVSEDRRRSSKLEAASMDWLGTFRRCRRICHKRVMQPVSASKERWRGRVREQASRWRGFGGERSDAEGRKEGYAHRPGRHI